MELIAVVVAVFAMLVFFVFALQWLGEFIKSASDVLLNIMKGDTNYMAIVMELMDDYAQGKHITLQRVMDLFNQPTVTYPIVEEIE